MNAPRHEIEARRDKMRTIDRATEQLLAYEHMLSMRAMNDLRAALQTMWPLLAAEVLESKDLTAKLAFEVTLSVKDGEPMIAVESQSKGELKQTPQIWKVHTYVCGKHAGFYEFTDRDHALTDMERRKRDYGVLGCHYSLEEPAPVHGQTD